jgi:phosphinothricin acetyltransferase
MIEVRSFQEGDWSFVQAIYQQGIDTKIATFQEKAKGWSEWNSSTLNTCRLVAVEEDEVVGWAAVSPISSRRVYAGVAEVSVYVSNAHQGKGIGKLLLSALVTESEKAGLWTLQAGIFPENIASIELHKKCGFRVVGVREKVGKMDGIWRDVLLLERRSKTTGV